MFHNIVHSVKKQLNTQALLLFPEEKDMLKKVNDIFDNNQGV